MFLVGLCFDEVKTMISMYHEKSMYLQFHESFKKYENQPTRLCFNEVKMTRKLPISIFEQLTYRGESRDNLLEILHCCTLPNPGSNL